MGSQDDNLQMPTHERIGSMATAKASAKRLHAEGSDASELGQRHSVPLDEARSIIEQWPEAPKKTAEKILDHYGPPNEATPTKLFWYRTGPWNSSKAADRSTTPGGSTPTPPPPTPWAAPPPTPKNCSSLHPQATPLTGMKPSSLPACATK